MRVAGIFEYLQWAYIAVWFFGASPVVNLAGVAAVPTCSTSAPFAVPEVEAHDAQAGRHGYLDRGELPMIRRLALEPARIKLADLCMSRLLGGNLAGRGFAP